MSANRRELTRSPEGPGHSVYGVVREMTRRLHSDRGDVEVSAEPEPVDPMDYPGRRPETDVTGREFR